MRIEMVRRKISNREYDAPGAFPADSITDANINETEKEALVNRHSYLARNKPELKRFVAASVPISNQFFHPSATRGQYTAFLRTTPL
jgi:hypothetical protein